MRHCCLSTSTPHLREQNKYILFKEKRKLKCIYQIRERCNTFASDNCIRYFAFLALYRRENDDKNWNSKWKKTNTVCLYFYRINLINSYCCAAKPRQFENELRQSDRIPITNKQHLQFDIFKNNKQNMQQNKTYKIILLLHCMSEIRYKCSVVDTLDRVRLIAYFIVTIIKSKRENEWTIYRVARERASDPFRNIELKMLEHISDQSINDNKFSFFILK